MRTMTEDARLDYSFSHAIDSNYFDSISDRGQRSLSLNFPGDSCHFSKENRQQSGASSVDDESALGVSNSFNHQQTKNSCKTLKCPKCNWHYKYKETLFIHMKEKHSDGNMQCLYCLTNEVHPRLARGETHSCGYKPFRCEFCNYSTTTKGNLSIHMQSDKHLNNVKEIKSPKPDSLYAFSVNDAIELNHRKRFRTENCAISYNQNAKELVKQSHENFPTLCTTYNNEQPCDMTSRSSSTESFGTRNSDTQEPIQCSAVSNEHVRDAATFFQKTSPVERKRSADFPIHDLSKNHSIKQERLSPPANAFENLDGNCQSLVQCPLCSIENSIIDLKNHLRECHKVTESGIENLITLMVKVRKNDASTHPPVARQTNVIKTPTSASEKCPVSFNDFSDISDRINKECSVENDELNQSANDFADKAYRCHVCARNFLSFAELKVHISSLGHQEVVERAPYFLCYKKGCNQYFTTNEALSIHFNEIHSKIFYDSDISFDHPSDISSPCAFSRKPSVISSSAHSLSQTGSEIASRCEKGSDFVSSSDYECGDKCMRVITEDIGLCTISAANYNIPSKLEESFWRCGSCPMLFHNVFILKEHLENHHGLSFSSKLLDSFANKIKLCLPKPCGASALDLSDILRFDSNDCIEINEEQKKILSCYFYTTRVFPCDEHLKMLEHQTSLPVSIIKNWFCKMFVKYPHGAENAKPVCTARESKGSSSDSHDSIDGCVKAGNDTRHQNFAYNSEYFYSPSKRANRTRFTDNQIRLLQEAFERNPYPKDEELELLSVKLKLSARVIVVWFQNARQKARKSYESQAAPLPLITKVEEDKSGGYFCRTCKRRFLRYHELLKHRSSLCTEKYSDFAANVSKKFLNCSEPFRFCPDYMSNSVHTPVDSERYSLPICSSLESRENSKQVFTHPESRPNDSNGIQNLLRLRTNSLNSLSSRNDSSDGFESNTCQSGPSCIDISKPIDEVVVRMLAWLKDEVTKSCNDPVVPNYERPNLNGASDAMQVKDAESIKLSSSINSFTNIPANRDAVKAYSTSLNARKVILDPPKKGYFIYDIEVEIKLIENKFIRFEMKEAQKYNTTDVVVNTTSSSQIKKSLTSCEKSLQDDGISKCVSATLNELVIKATMRENEQKLGCSDEAKSHIRSRQSSVNTNSTNKYGGLSNCNIGRTQMYPGAQFLNFQTPSPVVAKSFSDDRLINGTLNKSSLDARIGVSTYNRPMNERCDRVESPVKTLKAPGYLKLEQNVNDFNTMPSLQPRFFSLLNSAGLPNPGGFVNFCNKILNIEDMNGTHCNTTAAAVAAQKRLRTTILPEQQDYLMQKFSIDSNPSRKVLEEISCEVGLKKRVVQVWFQNTRARERKSMIKAQSQHINKRCIFCGSVFKLRNALENHLFVNHNDLITRESFDIDSFPDADISVSPFKNNLSSNMNLPFRNQLFLNKVTKPITVFTPPGHFSNPQILNQRKEVSYFQTPVSTQSLAYTSQAPLEVQSSIKTEADLDKSLDQSKTCSSSDSDGKKVIKLEIGHVVPLSSEQNVNSHEDFALRNNDAMDKNSYSGDEGDDEDSSKDFSFKSSSFLQSGSLLPVKSERSSPTAPLDLRKYNSTYGRKFNFSARTDLDSSRQGCISTSVRRFRTQMSPLQIRIMKAIFVVYKTPTMSECDQLGKHIDLQKRVVQVWFQNARAKEKKNPAHMKLELEVNFPTRCSSDSTGCLLCNIKYNLVHHQRDHLFTKEHVENLRQYFQTSMRSTENNTSNNATVSNNDIEQSCTRIHAEELPILPKSDVTSFVSSPLVYAAGILSNPFMNSPNQPSMFSNFTPVYESSLLPTQPFDPGVHGTPLMLLRLPHLALSHIAKMIQEDATIAQYTDDSSSSNELARMGYDVIPVTIDVGFVCKPCQLAWPRYDACLNHISRCSARNSNEKHSNRILKIEQLLHRCQPCKENFATLSEFLHHSKQPKHLALVGKT